jgi:hypothetical protein
MHQILQKNKSKTQESMRERQVAAEMAERRAASMEDENKRLREENDRLRDELRFLRTEVRWCRLAGCGVCVGVSWLGVVCVVMSTAELVVCGGVDVGVVCGGVDGQAGGVHGSRDSGVLGLTCLTPVCGAVCCLINTHT